MLLAGAALADCSVAASRAENAARSNANVLGAAASSITVRMKSACRGDVSFCPVWLCAAAMT